MDVELGEVQARFADLIWEHEPIGSGELVKLCEKGIFRNADGVVTSCVSREEFYAAKSERFVEESFSGSLPAFIAAFVSKKRLSEEDAEEIRRMIEAYRKGE